MLYVIVFYLVVIFVYGLVTAIINKPIPTKEECDTLDRLEDKRWSAANELRKRLWY